MIDTLGSNLISPMGVAVSYTAAGETGFILHPTTEEVPSGWGSAIRDAKGNRIFPGTPGGANSNTLLTKKGSAWKEMKNEVIQSVGNVDWWGPPYKVSMPDKRRILSWWGPTTRYFPDGFVYGSDSKHSELYYHGRICGVAPGPIIGAGLQLVDGTTTSYYMMVVCLFNNEETVFRKKFGTLATASKLSPDTRTAMAKVYDDANPTGWLPLGAATFSDPKIRPDSPWFFNQSGTEAQCIRRKELTFDPGTGTSITEIVGERYKLSINNSFAVSTKMPSEDPYAYKETCTKDYSGIWTSPADIHGQTHDWKEDHIAYKITHSGKQCVAVDYIGDSPVVCNFVNEIEVRLYQDWMLGVDAPGTPYGNKDYVQNTQPGSYTLEPRGHQAFTWTSMGVNCYLSWEAPDKVHKMTIEHIVDMTHLQYDTGQIDPGDLYRYYTEHYQLFLRHLDIRKFYMFGRSKMYREFIDAGVLRYKNVDYEFYDMDESDAKLLPILESSPDDTISYTVQGWYRSEMLTWPTDFSWQWTKTGYVGERPTDNDDGSKGTPPPKAFYNVVWVSIIAGWKGINLLRHPYYVADSAFSALPSGEFIGSMRVPNISDPGGGVTRALVYRNIDVSDLSAMTGGTGLYPLGVA